RRVGRQQPDPDRRQSHRQQRGNQRRLAADPIPEVAEQRRADRPGEEGDRERRQRRERRRGRVGGREEQTREDEHRRRRVDVEIEELDGGTNQAREQHLRRAVDAPDGGGGLLAHGRQYKRLEGRGWRLGRGRGGNGGGGNGGVGTEAEERRGKVGIRNRDMLR